MYDSATVLESCQKILGAESSARVGTLLFGGALKQAFPRLEWKSLSPQNGQSLYYYESCPDKNEIDLLFYTNIETSNPSHLSLWTETDHDPVSVTYKKNKIFGLGASHEKITLVAQALVVSKLKEEICNKKLNVMLVASYGRESKLRGAKRLIKEVVERKKIHRVVVAHPTNNKIKYGSSGRIKTKVFFPFSKEEKSLRAEHDQKENISSQSKVFNANDGETLEDNTVYKFIKDCKNLPKGTLILDLDGGTSTLSQPETTYFEVDFAPPFKNSMVSQLEGFGEFLKSWNLQLMDKFENKEVERALHIGRAYDSAEGLYFFGYNLIPASVSVAGLDQLFSSFKNSIREAGGEVTLLDAKSPYMSLKGSQAYTAHFTEAAFFSKYASDVVICGAGPEGFEKKPNEFVKLDQMLESCDVHHSFVLELLGGLE